jgi:hypothetical protein
MDVDELKKAIVVCHDKRLAISHKSILPSPRVLDPRPLCYGAAFEMTAV